MNESQCKSRDVLCVPIIRLWQAEGNSECTYAREGHLDAKDEDTSQAAPQI